MADNFSNSVENTAGKGEIAHYEQFLLFPQRFQKTGTAETYKPGLVWERDNLTKGGLISPRNALYTEQVIL